jgi:hypothetical protein
MSSLGKSCIGIDPVKTKYHHLHLEVGLVEFPLSSVTLNVRVCAPFSEKECPCVCTIYRERKSKNLPPWLLEAYHHTFTASVRSIYSIDAALAPYPDHE